MINGFKMFSSAELRKACYRFLPEQARGTKGLCAIGTKDTIGAALEAAGVTPQQVADFLGVNAQDDNQTTTTPATTTPATAEAAISALKTLLGGAVDEEQVKAIAAGVLDDAREELIAEAVRESTENNVKRLVVVKPETKQEIDLGLCHCKTEEIYKMVSCGINVMLVGAAGSGKTTAGEKVAKMLGVDFYPMSMGQQTTMSQLLGYMDAAGNYHTTPIREAFEKGGLLLLDEMDSANAGVLTILNALLANGYCSFPDKVVKRHSDFYCICAANTYGRGKDREYVGRNQLDAATLDRFAVLDFDYDENLERALARREYENADAWVDKVQNYRKRAYELRERIVISPRASINGCKLLAAGLSEDAVENAVIWKGVSGCIVNKIKAC